MTTPLDLAAIRARLEAAVLGPYTVEHVRATTPGSHGVETSSSTIRDGGGCWICEVPGDIRTAEFLAAARTDVGDLLDECERLRKELAEGEAINAEQWHSCHKLAFYYAPSPTMHGGTCAEAKAAIETLLLKVGPMSVRLRELTNAVGVMSMADAFSQQAIRDVTTERDAAIAELARLRAELLAEDAVIEAVLAEYDAADAYAYHRNSADWSRLDANVQTRLLVAKNETGAAAIAAVDALRAARAGKDGG